MSAFGLARAVLRIRSPRLVVRVQASAKDRSVTTPGRSLCRSCAIRERGVSLLYLGAGKPAMWRARPTRTGSPPSPHRRRRRDARHAQTRTRRRSLGSRPTRRPSVRTTCRKPKAQYRPSATKSRPVMSFMPPVCPNGRIEEAKVGERECAGASSSLRRGRGSPGRSVSGRATIARSPRTAMGPRQPAGARAMRATSASSSISGPIPESLPRRSPDGAHRAGRRVFRSEQIREFVRVERILAVLAVAARARRPASRAGRPGLPQVPHVPVQIRISSVSVMASSRRCRSARSQSARG